MNTTLAPLRQTKTILLTTFGRNGTPVATPVSIAFDGDRAFFRTWNTAHKAKRLRNNPNVEVAPSTLRGEPTGPAIPAKASMLEGRDARLAAKALARPPLPAGGPRADRPPPDAFPHDALRAEEHDMSRQTTEVIDEASKWTVGLGIITLALAPLALPMLVLTAVALVALALPLIAVGLVAAIVAVPVLLIRRLRRRFIRRSRPATVPRARPPSSRPASS
jgi:PPOX class probable F420-dependent enzyme